MGRALYEAEPVVREVLDRCDREIRRIRGTSLLEAMFGTEDGGIDLDDTKWAQPALYALETALAALWASVEVRPVALVGHSVGEIAAAHVAGVFGLEDGVRFAAVRGDLMAALPTEGARAGEMLAVFADADRVVAAMEETNARGDGVGLSMAAYNGSHQVVSGPAARIAELAGVLESEGVRVQRLNTSHGFHSALMDPVLDDLESAMDGVELSPPSVALVSNVTGRVVGPGEFLDGPYWRRHAREPVAFEAGVATLANLNVDVVLEIGPQPVLAAMVEHAWPGARRTSAGDAGGTASGPVVLASLRCPTGDASEDGARPFLEAVAGVYEAGGALSFDALFAGEARRRVSIPGYPFQRRRHWIDLSKRRRGRDEHPLLGVRRDSAGGEVTFETELFASDPAWLGDHQVFGRVIAPAALHGTLASMAAALALGSDRITVGAMQLHAPLVLAQAGVDDASRELGRTVQVVVTQSEDPSVRTVEIFSRGGSEGAWTLHAAARASSRTDSAETGTRVDLSALTNRMSARPVPEHYRALASAGIELGPAFRGLEAIWSGEGEAIGEVELPGDVDGSGLEVHPALLDGCLQVLSAAVDWPEDLGRPTYLPYGWDLSWLSRPVLGRVVSHARLTGTESASGIRTAEGGSEASTTVVPEVVTADLTLYDEDGVPLGGVRGFTLKRATRAALLATIEGVDELLYEVVWSERPLARGVRPADFLAAPEAAVRRAGDLREYLAGEGLEGQPAPSPSGRS